MSLFKVCSWWSANCPDVQESYDSFSLHCCRLGLEDNEKDYIVIGSHTGHLSIFYPESEYTDEQTITGFKPTDLVLENKLKSSIIGLNSGKFSGSPKNENKSQLLVLHPFSVCIYNVVTVEGVAEHGTHSSLQLVTEHKLTRYAFSICKGHFGGVKGREFICLTHMDGSLTFFEQDGITYSCKLPGDNVIPFNTVYVPRTDSFIRINSSWELDSFSYQDLSQSTENNSEINPAWSVSIGEFPLDMISVQITNTRTAIMILGERNLINISDDGKVQFIKKLDYSPICFHSFVVGWYWEPNARLVTAVVSENASLLVYDDQKLIWAARLEEVPVAIKRANLKNLPGGIVTLSSNGTVHVGFLGSDPHIFKAPAMPYQEINLEESHKELLELERQIKDSIGLNDGNSDLLNALTEQELEINIEVGQLLEPCHRNIAPTLRREDIFECTVIANVTANVDVDRLQIAYKYADGIVCSKPVQSFVNILTSDTKSSIAIFYVGEKTHICTTEVEAIVSYVNKQGMPRIISKHFFLPTKLFYKNVQAQKDAFVKVMISVNFEGGKSKMHNLSTIFHEFSIDADVPAIGLLPNFSEKVITIVAAKSTNRFRIQSDSLELIAPILLIMIEHFKSFESSMYNKVKDTAGRKHSKHVRRDNIVTISPFIPINEVIQRVENHYEVQQNIKKQSILMDAMWNQFRLFQRSLVSKPDGAPTDGLMMLIEKNYDDLVTGGDTLLEMRDNERITRNNLSCAIALVQHIVSCLDLNEKNMKKILTIFSFPIEDWTECSWEEIMAPAVDLLCRYGPLNRNRNKTKPLDDDHSTSALGMETVSEMPSLSSSSTNTVVNFSFNFDRFKQHMTSLMELACRIASDPKHKDAEELLAPSSNAKNNFISDDLISLPINNEEERIITTVHELSTDQNDTITDENSKEPGTDCNDNNEVDSDNSSRSENSVEPKTIPNGSAVVVHE